MVKTKSVKSTKVVNDAMINFRATLLQPKATDRAVSWNFLILPKEASARLPSRGQTTVEGTMNGKAGSEEWRWSQGNLK